MLKHTSNFTVLLQELFTAEAASEESSRAFLKSYSPYLVSVLMVEQKQDELAAVASAMGATLGCLPGHYLLRTSMVLLDKACGICSFRW